MQDLRVRFHQEIDTKTLINPMQNLQQKFHTAAKVFKVIDIAVDAVRLYKEPDLQHTKELAVSAVQLAALCVAP